MSESIAAVAEAGEVGELFRYDIDMPVSIKRQRSAMLPILNQGVETSKVSIYNRSVHAKHPLNGIRLKNTSDLHLMQGPITLFDGGVYAGDAKIPDLPANSERLVSYAMDLEVEVAPKHESSAKKSRHCKTGQWFCCTPRTSILAVGRTQSKTRATS